MSRKDYVAVAAIIAGERATARGTRNGRAVLRTTRNMALSLADMFARDNARFDRGRFYAACQISDPYSETGE